MEELEIPESDWLISLYEKVGRIYSEVGVFWNETADPETAYEVFAQFANWTPPRIAVEHASKLADDAMVEYEVRLYQNKKVVGSLLWNAETVAMCVEDYRSRKLTKFIVSVEVEASEDDGDDPLGWDLVELAENGQIKILDTTPTVVIS